MTAKKRRRPKEKTRLPHLVDCPQAEEIARLTKERDEALAEVANRAHFEQSLITQRDEAREALRWRDLRDGEPPRDMNGDALIIVDGDDCGPHVITVRELTVEMDIDPDYLHSWLPLPTSPETTDE